MNKLVTVLKYLGIVTAALATFALAWVYTSAMSEWYYRPLPIIPTNYELIAQKYISCTQPLLPEAYMQGWSSKNSEYSALMVFGRVIYVPEAGLKESDPLFWVFYPDGNAPYPLSESTYRIVTLPGKAAEYLTIDELKTRYPLGPCAPELQELP